MTWIVDADVSAGADHNQRSSRRTYDEMKNGIENGLEAGKALDMD